MMKPSKREKDNILSSVRKMVTRYVEQSPFFLNPDEVVVENVLNGLAMNMLRYGSMYCPCREVKGIPEQDRGNICPCQTHKNDIARYGTCECGLFAAKAYVDNYHKRIML